MNIRKKILSIIFAVCWIPNTVSAISVDAWGGYSIARSSAYDALDSQFTLLNTLATANGYAVTGSGGTRGGIAFGGDFWVGVLPKVDLGLGVAYMPLYALDWTATKGTSSIAMSGTIGAIPIMAQAKVSLLAGLYVGAGLGYALGTGTVKAVANGLTTSATAQGSVGAMMAMIGYDVISAGVVKFGLEVRYYIMLDTSTLHNILPLAKVEFGF